MVAATPDVVSENWVTRQRNGAGRRHRPDASPSQFQTGMHNTFGVGQPDISMRRLGDAVPAAFENQLTVEDLALRAFDSLPVPVSGGPVAAAVEGGAPL